MEEIVTIDGIKLPVGPPLSARMQEAIRSGRYERTEIELIRRALRQDDVVMEAGTGIGFVSTFCATVVGSDRVHTYEPNPELEPLILRTFELNYVRPELHLCALGSSSREDTFYAAQDFWGSSTQRRSDARPLRIPVRSFNEELERVKPSFLILDVEGGEHELLASARLDGVEKIVLELHPTLIGAERSREVVRALRRAGFAPSPELSWKRRVLELLFDLFGVERVNGVLTRLGRLGLPLGPQGAVFARQLFVRRRPPPRPMAVPAS